MKKTNETGRSMVEMLGVLAIVGVLSIGGIAGYTRAMKNWRANEIIDAANKVAAMVETEVAVTESLTYNAMVGDSETDAGKGKVSKIAGGVVNQITAYGIGATTNAGKVVVELKNGEDDLVTAVKEKLNCDGNDGEGAAATPKVCKLSKSIVLTISAASS